MAIKRKEKKRETVCLHETEELFHKLAQSYYTVLKAIKTTQKMECKKFQFHWKCDTHPHSQTIRMLC